MKPTIKERWNRFVCTLVGHDLFGNTAPIICGMCHTSGFVAPQCGRCGYYDRDRLMAVVRNHQVTKHTSYLSKIYKLRNITVANGASANEAATAARLLDRIRAKTTHFA